MALLNPIDLIGGMVPFYTRKYIPTKELKNHLPNDIRGMFLKLNLIKAMWLLFGCFHPQKLSDCFLDASIHHPNQIILQKYKSVENRSSVDLFITNSPLSFQYTATITTGLSDFCKMVITVLKTVFSKLVPNKVIYRDFKNFN